MVVRVENDRSNRVCVRRTSHAVAQGANFFYRGGVNPPLPPSTLAPALVICEEGISYNVLCQVGLFVVNAKKKTVVVVSTQRLVKLIK